MAITFPTNRKVEFGDALGLYFRNYANFQGRSSRGAYWWVTVWLLLISIPAAVVDYMAFHDFTTSHDGTGPVQMVFGLATVVPSLAVGVRRLHDVGRSGWWILIAFTVIGILLLLYWNIRPGQRQENRFGPDREAGREAAA